MSPWRRGEPRTETRLGRARETRVFEARLRRGMSAQLPPPPKAEDAPWKATGDNNDEEDRTT